MGKSILMRKRDLLYLIFFIIHLPVMFLVDLAPLYPAQVKPHALDTLRTWYIATYRDQFFVHPPAWFNMYLWMEALYHIPLSLWAIGGLLKDDPRVPLHLLVFAGQTGMSTITCVADYMSWQAVSSQEKMALGQLYLPYLALAVFMGVDMYVRLAKRLSAGPNVKLKI